MNLVLCLLVTLGCCFALPSSPLAWEDVKGKNVYIEPISNSTANAPIDGRVIGGTEVTPNSIPYQVAILINGRSFCGGSLISRNFVFTAAHCTINASFVELIFGAHNIQSSESTQVRITSTNIIIHDDYESASFKNDVSLVKTPSTINTNSYIQTITLAPEEAQAFNGSIALLTGWGTISDSSNSISSVLRGVYLNVIRNAECANTYGQTVQGTVICTSGAGVVGACNGDSGGPLVIGNVQIGMVSFVSSTGCEAGYPTGYARVSSFRNWIEENSDVTL